MNNFKAFKKSKVRDLEIVERLEKCGIKCRLASEYEDRKLKFDIVIEYLGKTIHVDTKYPNAKMDKFGNKIVWVEFTKVCGVAYENVDQIWYFIDSELFIIPRKSLIEFLSKEYDSGNLVLEMSNNARKGIDPADRLCWIKLKDFEKISINSINDFLTKQQLKMFAIPTKLDHCVF